MPSPIRKFRLDPKRRIWQGRFHELATPGKQPPLFDLCLESELQVKTSLSGAKRQRTLEEQRNRLEELYAERLHKEMEKRKAKPPPPPSPPIREVMQEWLDHVAAYASMRTVEEYSRICTLYVEAVGNHPMEAADTDKICKFSNALKKRRYRNRALSLESQKSYLTQLAAFFNWAMIENRLSHIVQVKKPRTMLREPRIYTSQDMDSICQHIYAKWQTAPNPHLRRCYWLHYRIAKLMRYTGMRAGEVWSLPLSHIRLQEGVIHLQSVPELGWLVKNRKEAKIPISPALGDFLSMDMSARQPVEIWYLDNGKGQLEYAAVNAMTHVFNRYKKALGLNVNPLHSFRSGVASELLEAGEDITTVGKLLRHSDLKTTMRYIKKSDDSVSQAVKKLGRQGSVNDSEIKE